MLNLQTFFRKSLIHGVILAAMLLGMLATPQRASASTIRVNVTTDEYGGNVSNCSLREAIRSANEDISFDGCAPGSGEDTIVLEAKTYELSIGVTNYKADALDQDGAIGDLDIYSPMRIVGVGQDQTIIRPINGAKTRIFHIAAVGVNVAIQQVTLTNGYAYWDNVNPLDPPYETLGGAIYNEFGRLTLWRSTVTANRASHSGGGVYSDRENSNNLYILDSTIDSNTAEMGDGGGIVSESSMNLVRSLVWNNTSEGGNGGGVYNNAPGRLMAVTVAENKVLSTEPGKGRGSGIYADTVIEVLNSTIIRNTSASRTRYGFEISAGKGVVFNNIIAYNLADIGTTSFWANCWFSDPVYGAYNYRNADELGSDGKSICTGYAGSAKSFFLTTADMNLSPTLDYNLGWSKSYAIQYPSALIDAGQPQNWFTHPETGFRYLCTGADQRWAVVPMDGDGNGSRICDPGAVEYSADGSITYRKLFLPMLVR